MTIQLAASQRNAMAQALEDDIGGSGVIKVFDASIPANTSVADNGNVLVQFTLAADSFTIANGVMDIPSGLSATGIAGGTAVHYRLYASDGTTVKQQGSVAQSGGDLNLDNTSIAIGQTVNVTQYELTMPNAG